MCLSGGTVWWAFARERRLITGTLNSDDPVKCQRSDDKVESFRCKACKYEGMRRTYWYAGLAELPGRHE